MNDSAKLCETLNKVFSNPNFIEEIATSQEMNFIDAFALVFEYYIATRDTNTHYSLKEIQKKIDDFLENNIEEAIENTIIHGFLSHAFNGYKMNRIKKYGVNYEENNTLKSEIEYGRKILNELEKLLGKSDFTINEEKKKEEKNFSGNTIYMSSIGKGVVEYALALSPERFYLGPLAGDDIEVIIGETKAQHYYRLLEKKLCKKYKEADPEKYYEGIKLAKKVVEYYCTKRPCIALIDIDKILDVPLWTGWVGNRLSFTMREIVPNLIPTKQNSDFLSYFLENHTIGMGEKQLSNLVTMSNNIPKEAVHVVQLEDFFTLFQMNARLRNYPLGTKFCDFDGAEKLINDNCEIATIGEMRGIVGNLFSVDDLEELKDQVAKRKSIVLSMLENPKKKINEFGLQFNSVEELKKLYNDLEKEEKDIFDRQFVSKNGIEQKESLKDVINRLKATGTFATILEKDKILKRDRYQYKSDLQGISHVRRVAFLLNLIAENEKISQRERELLFSICLNYNIGKRNEFEDKELGELSAKKMQELIDSGEKRLEGLNFFECEIAKYVITQQSLSEEEQKKNLKELKETEKRQQYLYKIIQTAKNRQYNKKESINSFFLDDFFNGDEKTIKENIKTFEDERAILLNKFPFLVYNNTTKKIERIVNCFNDGNELEKVRFSPDGDDLDKGYNSRRLRLDSSKELEGLSYECLDKLIEILDIEHAKREIEKYIEISEELNDESKIESEIDSQLEKCRNNSSAYINKLVDKSISLVDIKKLPNKIRLIFNNSRIGIIINKINRRIFNERSD